MKHSIEQTSAYPSQKDAYILGGGDREMARIERVLKDEVDKQRALGKEPDLSVIAGMTTWEEADTKVESRQRALETARAMGATAVFIEHRGADELEADNTDVVHIDHHDKNSYRPAAILQVLERLGLEPTFVDKVVAANDSKYIPGIVELLDQEYKTRYVEGKIRLLEDRGDPNPRQSATSLYENVKAAVVDRVRLADRAAQGVTPEMEAQAIEAIANRQNRNGLTVISVDHGRTSPVQDRLYGTWGKEGENLVIICEARSAEKEVWFFGPGDVAKYVQEHFKALKQERIDADPENEPPRRGIYHTVGGGLGFGKEGEIARCLVVASDAEEVIRYVLKLEGRDQEKGDDIL